MDKLKFKERLDKAKDTLGNFYGVKVHCKYPNTDMSQLYNTIRGRAYHEDILKKIEATAKAYEKNKLK